MYILSLCVNHVLDILYMSKIYNEAIYMCIYTSIIIIDYYYLVSLLNIYLHTTACILHCKMQSE